jgi:tetratricopeptide (TPR) repeat protein
MNRRILTAVLFLGLGTTHPVAWAQAPAISSEETSRDRGVRLFREAAEHYRAGRFRVAVELLRESYELHPEPLVLFNLGRSLEGLGELEAAVDAYRRFLEAAPDATDRGAVEARIATLQRLVDERRALDEAAASAADARQQPDEQSEAPALADEIDAGSIVLAGVGLAGLIVGSILAGAAVTTHNQWVDAPSHASALESLAAANDLASAANVALAIGGALALAGGVWLAVDAAESGEGAPSASVRLGPSHAALHLSW